MPELNFDYQAVRDAILNVALYWMSFGLDGFRLDAVKHVYMENENDQHSNHIVKDTDVANDADYSYDLKKNEHFFLEFNAKLKASYPNALLLGENLTGDPAKLAALYGGFDSQFNFNFYFDTTGCLSYGSQQYDAGEDWRSNNYIRKVMSKYVCAQMNFEQKTRRSVYRQLIHVQPRCSARPRQACVRVRQQHQRLVQPRRCKPWRRGCGGCGRRA